MVCRDKSPVRLLNPAEGSGVWQKLRSNPVNIGTTLAFRCLDVFHVLVWNLNMAQLISFCASELQDKQSPVLHSVFTGWTVFFIHHSVCWPQQKHVWPPVAQMSGVCPARGHHCRTVWIHEKSKRAFSLLVTLYSHAILLFPHTSLTSLHTLDQLPYVCVFVSWSVAIMKWRPQRPHQEASVLFQNWPASQLISQTHTYSLTIQICFTKSALPLFGRDTCVIRNFLAEMLSYFVQTQSSVRIMQL